jgi:hypothetical protein
MAAAISCYGSIGSFGPLSQQENQRLFAAGDVAVRLVSISKFALCTKLMKGPAPCLATTHGRSVADIGPLLDQMVPERTTATLSVTALQVTAAPGHLGSSLFPGL